MPLSIRSEFESRRRAVTMVVIAFGVVAGVIMLLLYADVVDDLPLLAVFVLCVVLGVAANLRLWRCPACSGHLGKLYLGLRQPRFCPRCGVQLVDDDSA